MTELTRYRFPDPENAPRVVLRVGRVAYYVLADEHQAEVERLEKRIAEFEAAAALPGPAELAALRSQVENYRGALVGSPCSCQLSGTCSIPPQPTDVMNRTWCGRCRALGYDRIPERSVFGFSIITDPANPRGAVTFTVRTNPP